MTTMPYTDKIRAVKKQRFRLAQGLPATMQAFAAMSEAATAPGKLDGKTKGLIGLALAVGARCDECIAIHVREANAAGASGEEIVEALGVAILMGGGPSLMYATHALTALEEMKEKTE